MVRKDIVGFSEMDLMSAYKADYARDLLFILCLGCSKLSVLTNLVSISPNLTHRHASYVLLFFIVIWTTSSFFTTTFQCGTQEPWIRSHSQRCINQKFSLVRGNSQCTHRCVSYHNSYYNHLAVEDGILCTH
ncbi:hypothetical protein F5B18DRAFT_635646 [Nemania serpens]|nr:hypothetical protein F5B18DRAFT_635646 [Nemania serpens]